MTLDNSQGGVTTDGSKSPVNEHMTLPAPSRSTVIAFGDYDVVGELGEGGMGRVYKAVDRNLGRFVAIKVLRSTEPFECSRFRGEAELIATLEHTNIVQIFAVDTAPDGRPYIVLEFAEGGSLDRELSGQPQEPRRAAEMMETIARAVHYAHEKGVIHRDLKPANILRSKDRTLKLTDFGLAKDMEVSSGMTPSNAVMGTPSYMSPEQAEGKTKQLSPTTDVYGLGAILYEMLTGRPPFRGVNMVDTLEQVRWAEPAPPTRLAPRLPRDLSTICLKCLQKSPVRRYQTAGEFADDLRRWMNGETIAARPAPSWERLLRQMKRRPWEAATIVAVVLLFASIIGTGLYAREKNRQRDADARVRTEQDEAAARLTAAEDAQQKLLNQRADEAFEVLEKIRKRLTDGDLKSTPGLDGLYGDLTAYYRKLIDERLADATADRADLAKRTFEIGELAARSGQFETAEWAFRHSDDLHTALPADLNNRQKTAAVKGLLARAVFDLGRDADALELATAAHALWSAIARDTATADPTANRAAGPNSDALKYREARAQIADVELFRGEVHVRRHALDAARKAFDESIRIRREIGQERLDLTAEDLANKLTDVPRRLRVIGDLRALGRGHGWLGDVYLAEGDVARADREYCDSFDIREKVAKALELIPKPTKEEKAELERAQFQLARAWGNLAKFQVGRGAPATAATFTKKALVLREQLVQSSPNNIDYKVDLCNNLNQAAELELLDRARKPDAWKSAADLVERAIQLASASDAYKQRAAVPLAESYALRAELRDRQGSPDATEAVIETRARLEELCREYPNQPNYPFRLATVLALDARMKGAAPGSEPWRSALAALARAVEKGYRGKHPDAIRTLPVFEPIRDDPRFKDLLAQLRG